MEPPRSSVRPSGRSEVQGLHSKVEQGQVHIQVFQGHQRARRQPSRENLLAIRSRIRSRIRTEKRHRFWRIGRTWATWIMEESTLSELPQSSPQTAGVSNSAEFTFFNQRHHRNIWRAEIVAGIIDCHANRWTTAKRDPCTCTQTHRQGVLHALTFSFSPLWVASSVQAIHATCKPRRAAVGSSCSRAMHWISSVQQGWNRKIGCPRDGDFNGFQLYRTDEFIDILFECLSMFFSV